METAASRASAVEDQIDHSADQKVQTVEKAKKSTQDRSKAVEDTVTAAAEAELDDAAAKRRAATGARAHADRLEDLSDAEKEKRQAVRKSEP